MRFCMVEVKRSETESVVLGIPSWEVPVIRLVHGGEKVKVVGEKYTPRALPTAQVEYDRLTRRYGSHRESDTPFVALVYGHDASKLESAIEAEAEAEDALLRQQKEAEAEAELERLTAPVPKSELALIDE